MERDGDGEGVIFNLGRGGGLELRRRVSVEKVGQSCVDGCVERVGREGGLTVGVERVG